MKAAALGVILLAAASATASAGTYLGVAIGTAPNLGGSNAEFQPDGRSGQLLIGQRFSMISLEGGVTGFSLLGNGTTYDSISLTAQAKLSLPLGNNFEVFARGGVERTYWSTSGDSGVANLPSLSGNGLVYGLGVEYRLNLVLTGVSVWIDYTRHQDTLDAAPDSGQHELGTSFGLFSLGATIGI